MRKIKIVTDSGCDLPDQLLAKYDIDMIPLSVHFGDKTYLDRFNLSVDQFYEMLTTDENLPRTSQINPEQYLEVFEHHLNQDTEILVIGLSLKLTGSLQSAKIARDMLNTDKIHIFDSKSASLGEGLYVLKAAELIKDGLNIESIINELENYQQEAYGLFVLDSLKHLLRGGRLSRTSATIGSLLNIKPVLCFANTGEILVKERVRSQKKALDLIIERFKEQEMDFTQKRIAIAHTKSLAIAEEFAEVVEQELKPKDIVLNTGGSAVATHVGVGGIGLFV